MTRTPFRLLAAVDMDLYSPSSSIFNNRDVIALFVRSIAISMNSQQQTLLSIMPTLGRDPPLRKDYSWRVIIVCFPF